MLLATAGHVDHGKTTLIKALTGVETDRLKEEKARGLSIDLGFAYLDAPDGQSIGFVDVPGHEKFIRNMAAGIAAIDIALLVVAADDGVMPQTREHAAILGLFGISQCVVVVTRIDLVDDSQVDEAVHAAESLLTHHTVQVIASHRVSSISGAGIDSLKSELFSLSALSATLPPGASDDYCFRLALDRSFTVPGAGTIATGTVYNGGALLSDSLQHLPSRQELRVKALHINGKQAGESDVMRRGHRVAFNLANLGASEIQRGDWISAREQSTLTDCIDIELSLLADEIARLKHWSSVHVHFASSSLMARVSLYENRQLEPGQSGMAQLVLSQPVHTVFGDRLVLRDTAATRTIGGGVVVEPFSNRHRGYRRGRAHILALQNNDNTSQVLSDLLQSETEGVHAGNFRQSRNIPLDKFQQILESLDVVSTAAQLHETGAQIDRLFGQQLLHRIRQSILTSVEKYHQQYPEEAGIPQNQLLDAKSKAAQSVSVALGLMLQSRELARSGSRVKLVDFVPVLDSESAALLETIYKDVGPDVTKPPSLSALEEATGLNLQELNERVQPLVKAGYLVLVSKNRVYHPQAIQLLASLAQTLYEEQAEQGFDARTFRDRAGIGRNITIEVLEYLDAEGYTRRIGDRRFYNP